MVGLSRRLLAEFVGTALLTTAVVGSGVMASRLSHGDVGLQLLENSIATMLALAVLIVMLAPVSGAHFNPLVSAAAWWLGRREQRRPTSELAAYVAVQVVGAIAGAVLANVMFGLPAVAWSTTTRSGVGVWIGEVVATAGLVGLIFLLIRSGRAALVAPAVGAYIGAAYWFTSSTSFANPALTVGRAFTDSFAGIAPSSVAPFLAAQLVGALLGILLVWALSPVGEGERTRGRPAVSQVGQRGSL